MFKSKKSDSSLKVNTKPIIIASICFIIFMLLLTIGCLVYLKELTDNNTKEIMGEEYQKYDNYYVMISGNRKSYFWKRVYEGAKEALDENSYIEVLGNNLSEEYSTAALMQIAINSRVDGIILEAAESTEITRLINEANDAGIPVVTAVNDNNSSMRKSFVGVNSYNLGMAYGQQVCEIVKASGGIENGTSKTTVLVLMNANTDNNIQNIVFSGIKDAVKDCPTPENIDLKTIAISNNAAFAAEEFIRDIFIKQVDMPDIIICMDELNTTCVYQEAVDYNKVGRINIIGYDDSDTILRGIERNVIYSTISVDTKQIGADCIKALEEYKKTGHVSAYFDVDISVITADNVNKYLGDTDESVIE
ncbi:ribose transport system substrate-binding protein [Ruminiclostridium sufflavum DSM 19573]|uniref:Ribose transport system substrate-binding protein n=1 Tax=Ruminiclostridium sufflavum DSM 19573 TaxID=1121337 RepID=A0A318XLX0_9FIRM|nr:substrate-binding domain-containing protein [Ruminiclostridium sufflavum]PYG87432.1 ribose transport system substrate-binding protein [Ruminiclostridium sufflavum DSM 19573]